MRLEAKDLRIGNLVKGASREEIVVVTSPIISHVDNFGNGFIPIPITKYILTNKLGFREIHQDKRYVGRWYELGEFNIHYDKGDYHFYKNKTFLGVKNYLHKLQNIIYELSNEELPTDKILKA